MDSSINSHLIAQHIQDRIAEATSARAAREAKLARAREPRLRHVRSWLGRHAPAETTAPGSIAALPPS